MNQKYSPYTYWQEVKQGYRLLDHDALLRERMLLIRRLKYAKLPLKQEIRLRINAVEAILEKYHIEKIEKRPKR